MMNNFAFARRAAAYCLRGDRFSKSLLPKAALAFSLLLAFFTHAAKAADSAPCQIHRIASLDLHLNRAGVPAVPVTIAGQTKSFIVDTGFLFSALAETKARAMNLKLQSAPPQMFRMFDGSVLRYQAFAPGFMIGQIPLPNYTFMIVPDDQIPSEDDGLLAPDILSHFDIELDFTKSKFNIFLPNSCGDRVVYWGSPYARLPIRFDDTALYNGGQVDLHHIYVDGTLDGAAVKLEVDTGSTDSAMTLQQAEVLLGWHGLPPDVQKEPQFNGDDVYSYIFKTLNIGGITVSNLKVRILDVHERGGVSEQRDMLVGMDVLRQLHVYIAYPEKALYVTPAAPPSLPPEPTAASNSDALIKTGMSDVQKGDNDGAIAAFNAALASNPAAGAALIGRSEAYARKKEYDLAIADDSQALRLDAKNVTALVGRGLVYAMKRDFDNAITDFNEAIRLNPSTAIAFGARGGVHLEKGEIDLAKADAESVARLEPDSADAEMLQNQIFVRQHDYAKAIAALDQVLKKNPALFSALNDRCYDRALLRQGFDKALMDCNAALKLVPDNPTALDSRGFVYFLMGKFDLAKVDYDAAIASRSSPSTLYKRGILKNRLGDSAGGKVDIDAALKIDPQAGDDLVQIGVMP